MALMSFFALVVLALGTAVCLEMYRTHPGRSVLIITFLLSLLVYLVSVVREQIFRRDSEEDTKLLAQGEAAAQEQAYKVAVNTRDAGLAGEMVKAGLVLGRGETVRKGMTNHAQETSRIEAEQAPKVPRDIAAMARKVVKKSGDDSKKK